MIDAPWEKVRDLLDSALELPEEERSRYLDAHCHDPQVRKSVEVLIESYEQSATFLEDPLHSAFASPDGDWSGRVLGSYRLLDEIGVGGMARVYRAVRADDEYNQNVAVKIISGVLLSKQLVDHFRAERQILANLNHPNIARLLDGGTTKEGLPYLVMEFVEGTPIHEYCDAHRLSVRERLELFVQLCSAVQYAHQNLIVHRDLKPGNILVTPGGVPKLLDFGIAKILRSSEESAGGERTLTIQPMMTPGYASPEQLENRRVTTASDVYSLGVVLYLLLTGHRRYVAHSAEGHDVARAISTAAPIRPSNAIGRAETVDSDDQETTTAAIVNNRRASSVKRLKKELSGDLDAIILKSLEKDTTRRYASAEQFAGDIRRYLAGQPVSARLPTLGYRALKFAQRHAVAVTAAVAVAICSMVAVGLIVRAQRQAEKQRARAEQRFNDVRKLANSLVFEIYDSIKDLSGATPSRKLLVDRALQYLDSLSAEASDDRSLQTELAAAYLRIGDVQGNPAQANQGDLAGALASYRKGLQILLPLSKQDDVNALSQLSDAYYKIAQCLDAMGDYQGALQSSRDALSIDQKLSASGDPKDVDNLAGDYNDVGVKLERIGELPAALESYRRASEIRETIKATDPNQINKIHLHLASDYAGQAEVLMLQRQFTQAVPMQQRAINILQDSSKKNPDNGSLRFGLGQAYEYSGPILEKAGDRVQALQNYREAIAIFQQASIADPKDELARRFLGFSYQYAGRLLVKEGNIQGGLADLRHALAIFESTLSSDAGNDFAFSGAAETYSGMGFAEAALAASQNVPSARRAQHWREAEAWYNKSLEIWLQMRDRGALARIDADKPEQIATAIAKCHEGLKRH